MSYKFNPLSGALDLVESLDFKKIYKDVDLALISSREIDLGVEPIDDSEMFFINGLILKDDCYTISSTILTIDADLDIRVGDAIDIRFAN